MEKTILILEDEKEIAQLYAKRLKDKGYVTELAFDGLEGLEKLKTLKPDLILLDLNMPRMGGLEFYQHICDSKGIPKHPVLVLTGRADLEKLFKEFHVDGFIIKPFDGSRLSEEVEIILNKHHWEKTDGSAKKVVIIDDNALAAKKIQTLFTTAGYTTDIASSGISGIERVMADPPDLAIVKLGLADLSGDLVILRLQQLAKTKKTSSMLYVSKEFSIDPIVLDKMASKSGINLFVEFSEPEELVKAADKIFKGLETAKS